MRDKTNPPHFHGEKQRQAENQAARHAAPVFLQGLFNSAAGRIPHVNEIANSIKRVNHQKKSRAAKMQTHRSKTDALPPLSLIGAHQPAKTCEHKTGCHTRTAYVEAKTHRKPKNSLNIIGEFHALP
jgi:hypothetical protein